MRYRTGSGSGESHTWGKTLKRATILSVLATAAVTASLAVGPPASADIGAAPTVSLAGLPATMQMPLSSGKLDFPVAVTVPSTTDYVSVTGTATHNLSSVNLYGSESSVGGYFYDGTDPAGRWTITVTVEDHTTNSIVTARGSLMLKGSNPDLSITAASGEMTRHSARTVSGTASVNAVGAHVNVFYKARGHQNYRLVGHAKVRADSLYEGQWMLRTKKILRGRVYVVFPGTKKLVSGRTASTPVVALP
jgi:hypothetical protein